ncbi:DNA repair protein RecO [Roseateles puraquae]|jgi:DNA repair protein RecO (recombination protein O)|uniref:DNA repair protein RecO n=1 Tax=Roseateles puraquae TaxID=431059 RepID=A0A254NE17_9BURK|nr:DNA repair protein RecO [Roseateles puraquae]MDG0855345.1 DNA repair protein RecO [Roseateles puraquae]OWR03403.1 DNA repair protein RecO [Roseateles puraquae]
MKLRTPTSQPAYVLHQHDWSESSLILDLFTRESGRVAVAAKGAKRPYSQLRAVLLPLQRITVSLSKPAKAEGGEVQTLRSAEWGGGNTLPSGAALFSGYYLNELLLKLLARHDPHPQLFDAYADTLAHLTEGDAALRAFELKLLAELGLLPDLSVVTPTQAAVDPTRRYQLSPESGVIPPTADASLAGSLLIQLQAALLHGSPAALRQACAAAPQVLKTTLRGLLHYHLGHQPLRTRALLMDVQQLLDA